MGLLTLQSITNLENQAYAVIAFQGELDKSSIPLAEKEIADMLNDFRRDYLIFDLTALKYLNSEGIGFVVSVHATLSKTGKQLFLCGMQPNVADIFNAIGLSRLIPVYRSLDEAVSFVKKN